MANVLEACLYCPGQTPPRSRAKRKRLADTPRNRAREFRLYLALANPRTGPGSFTITLTPNRWRKMS